jgi:hypothetical protein
LANGGAGVPAPRERWQCQQPDAVDGQKRLPHYRKYRKFSKPVREAVPTLRQMYPCHSSVAGEEVMMPFRNQLSWPLKKD